MERPDVGRTVAEEGERDARLLPELEGERGAGDRRQPAADDGVRSEVAALDVVEVHRPAVAVRAAFELSVQLGHQRVRRGAPRERVPVGPVGRGDHVVLLERRADADRDGLLADRDVQEPRQLAGPEPLLDHLLEAPDQQHVAQEIAQSLVAQALFLRLDFRHGRQCTLLPVALADDFRALLQDLPNDWEEASIVAHFHDEPTARRAAALLLSLNPGHHDGAVRFVDLTSGGSSPRPRAARPAPHRRGTTRRRGGARVEYGRNRRSPKRRAPPSRLPGTSRSRRCLRTGATSTPSWSYARPTTSSRGRCSPRRSTLPASTSGPAFRFRCAREFGYGAAPGMVRRCLERLDGAEIRGEVRILRALSDTKPWATQGPVWYVDGRSV